MKTSMHTIKIENTVLNGKILDEAGATLRQGGLVAFPTETVYGLGADALQPLAAEKIYLAKGRPSDNPLIVHIADFDALQDIVEEIPKEAYQLAEKFWPGPLTMIMRKSDRVPLATTGGLATVAVRMPKHPIALALIRAGGGYVAAPSANTSGRPSPTKAEHVWEDLNGKIDMILDGGAVGIGLESTIVDLSEEIPTILRPGSITKTMLETVIPHVDIDKGLQNVSARPKAPGMKYRHYAPKAKLVIVDGTSQAVIKKIQELSAGYEAEQVGIICTDETRAHYTYGIIKDIGSRKQEESIARNLYAILREFDASGVEVIFSEALDTPDMGQAIMNRLLKAAGYQVIQV